MTMPIDYARFEGHTPGPVVVSRGAIWQLETVRGDATYRVASVVYEADARLFAAAPELLAEFKRQAEEIERLREALDRLASIGSEVSINGFRANELYMEHCDALSVANKLILEDVIRGVLEATDNEAH